MNPRTLVLSGLATLACATSKPESSDSPSSPATTIEDVLTGTTNSSGTALSGEKVIGVYDQNGSPLAGVHVKLVEGPSFDLYLAQGPMGSGGALYEARNPVTHQSNTLTQALSGRSITIRTDQPVTVFEGGNQVTYDLTQWMGTDPTYICNGIVTTKQIDESNNTALELFAYIPVAGGAVQFAYAAATVARDSFLPQFDPQTNWFELTPENPTDFPLLMQRGLAQHLLDERTYDTLNTSCPDKTMQMPGEEEYIENCVDFRNAVPVQEAGFYLLCSDAADRATCWRVGTQGTRFTSEGLEITPPAGGAPVDVYSQTIESSSLGPGTYFTLRMGNSNTVEAKLREHDAPDSSYLSLKIEGEGQGKLFTFHGVYRGEDKTNPQGPLNSMDMSNGLNELFIDWSTQTNNGDLNRSDGSWTNNTANYRGQEISLPALQLGTFESQLTIRAQIGNSSPAPTLLEKMCIYN